MQFVFTVNVQNVEYILSLLECLILTEHKCTKSNEASIVLVISFSLCWVNFVASANVIDGDYC